MNDILSQIENQVVKQTPKDFSKLIVEKVKEKNCSYFEALTLLIKEKDYEPEYAAKLLTPEIKSKITDEALALSLVKKDKFGVRLDF